MAIPSDGVPVTPWRTWRVFHDALAERVRQVGPERADALLSRQLGLVSGSAVILRQEGARYLGDVESLERAARVQVQDRYAAPVGAVGTGPALGEERPVLLPRGQTLRAVAERDGLYETVEASFNSRLSAHLGALRQELPVGDFTIVESWVSHAVAERLQSLVRGPVFDERPRMDFRSGYVARQPVQR
jgi:hypothetical protein